MRNTRNTLHYLHNRHVGTPKHIQKSMLTKHLPQFCCMVFVSGLSSGKSSSTVGLYESYRAKTIISGRERQNVQVGTSSAK